MGEAPPNSVDLAWRLAALERRMEAIDARLDAICIRLDVYAGRLSMTDAWQRHVTRQLEALLNQTP